MTCWFSVQGIKAREILHGNMEKIIEEKMERQQAEEEYYDAFDYMMSSSKEHGHQLSIQELKVQEDDMIRMKSMTSVTDRFRTTRLHVEL